MNNIKYTFLLPSYKALFFEEALQSIKNQTYRDFKVIVSDDCSPEDLKSIYDKVCGDDPRFIFRRNKENMGSKSLVSHWNMLVDMCDTEWLIMAGDDDVYEPAFLEEMDKLQVKYPNVDLLHARARIIDAEGDVIKLDCAYDEYVSQISFLTQYHYYNHVECIGNYIIKHSKLFDCHGFIEMPLAWFSDTITTSILSKSGVVNSALFLFNFRLSGMNISSRKDRIFKNNICKAIVSYDDIMTSLFSNIEINNSLESMELIRYKSVYANNLVSLMLNYIDGVTISDFFYYIKLFRRKKYLSNSLIWLYLKKWLYSFVKNLRYD